MTTPDVPLRMELTFELPGTPEQVWDAIATANGISVVVHRRPTSRSASAAPSRSTWARTASDGHRHRLGPAAPHRVRGARLGRARRPRRARRSRRWSPSSSSRRSPAARACCAS